MAHDLQSETIVSLNQLFDNARTHSAWLDKPVSTALLGRLYTMTAFGPTAANCQPLRVVFVMSEQAKQRLVPLMAEGNRSKTEHAPVTAILAYDLRFYEHLHKLYPHQPDAASWFNSNDLIARDAALKNSSLQAGYFMMAARALGLDCGPMGGFETEAVNREFFPNMSYEINLICNLGYGDKSRLHPRLPRLGFDEACTILL